MKGIKLVEDKKGSKMTFIVEINENKIDFVAKELFSNRKTTYYPFYKKGGKYRA